MHKIFFIFFCLCSLSIAAQPSVYTTANAHSHNDYEQPTPFWEAYNHGFGSIEADIFLMDDDSELLVAHTPEELAGKRRRLDSLYLIPIVACIEKWGGTPYADTAKKLQLLIDVKTTAAATLHKLIQTIERHPMLTHNPALRFVISGNRPAADSFALYPSYILFDGELSKTYSFQALAKIALLSDDLKKYTSWNGEGRIPKKELAEIKSAIAKAHALKKPVRFWDAPDTMEAWHTLMHLKVDYINTDKISSLAGFLSKPANK